MPKQIIDYSKTIMYKLRHITDINDEDVYIGHTTNWSKRKIHHKTDCNCITGKRYNEKKNVEIRAKGGWGEWEMLPIELYPCSNKIEAVIREEYWRKDFNAKLNTKKAHTTEEEKKERSKERYEANKENELEYQIKYKNENKEKILAQAKEKITCECGCIVLKWGLNRHMKSKKHLDLMNK